MKLYHIRHSIYQNRKSKTVELLTTNTGEHHHDLGGRPGLLI